MKILIFSDSHGKLNNLKTILKENNNEVQYVIHLGDYDSDISEIKPFFQNYEFINISGNCDFSTTLPTEKVFTLENNTFFITHGHIYNVKSNLVKISYAAEERNANICLFGHTHVPVLTYINNILFMNPGSISQPRGNTSYTYGIIEFEDNKIISAKIIEITSTGKKEIMNFKNN